jgi:hypothetical protein
VKVVPLLGATAYSGTRRESSSSEVTMNIDDNLGSLAPKFPVSQLNFSLQIKVFHARFDSTT